MSTHRLLTLAKLLKIKYADIATANEEISMHDAVEFLTPMVSRQPISKDGKSYPWYGQQQANEVLIYIKGRLNNQPTRQIANVQTIDSIVAFQVYTGVPDNTVSVNMKVLLDALKDQRLEESGQFTVAMIQPTIDRHKKALANAGSGEAASIWSSGGAQRLSDWQAKDRQERATKEQQLAAYRQQQATQKI